MNKIFHVFPYNNPVTLKATKPVVLAGVSIIKYSDYFKDITVISKKTTDLIFPDKTVEIDASSKKDYIKKLIILININKPKIVEVQQDTALAYKLTNLFPDINVFLIRHGEKLSSKFKEKIPFYKRCYGKKLKPIKTIFGISNYVTNTLKNNYPELKDKFITLYNSYGYLFDKEPNVTPYSEKENKILFVGKAVKFKGFDVFCNAVTDILELHKDFSVDLILAVFSNKKQYTKEIKKIMKDEKFNDLVKKGRINIYQNLSNTDVFKHMQVAKIAVVPSKFNEPFGLVALEAHLAGCLVLSTNVGGLPEISGENRYKINNLSKEDIFSNLETAINNKDISGDIAYSGYKFVVNKFNPAVITKVIDDIRKKYL